MLYAQTKDGLINVKQWKFPAGEVGIKIEPGDVFKAIGKEVTIHLTWESNDDLMALGQLVDALRTSGATRLNLSIPYFPYSRQDRRCFLGEGHALKMVGAYINSMGFANVMTKDAHSYVLEAVVDNLTNIPQAACAIGLPVYDFLIAPDAGAAKKIGTHRQVVEGQTRVLTADKVRGAGGKITKSVLHDVKSLEGFKVCVVDDLCDGGATFTSLADVIFADATPAKLDLYVTHGLFTKGVDVLLKCFDTIYTHNLMNPDCRAQVKEI